VPSPLLHPEPEPDAEADADLLEDADAATDQPAALEHAALEHAALEHAAVQPAAPASVQPGTGAEFDQPDNRTANPANHGKRHRHRGPGRWC